MTPQAGRRIAALEALPASQRTLSPEEVHANHVAAAARCGLTEAEVMARFNGWPGFVYAKMIGEVVDPTVPEVDAQAWLAGRDPVTAYLDLIRVGTRR